MPRRVAGRMIRTAGRTAVIAGTATAVSGRVARRQQRKMIEEHEAMVPQSPQEVSQPVAGGPVDDSYEQLKKLAELRDQGILTEEEFAAKKAQILGL